MFKTKDVKYKESENIKKFDAVFLSGEANKWLDSCLESLRQALSDTFKYTNNIKHLVVIRDAVIDLEYEIQSESQSPLKNQQNTWSHICESLFGKKIELWSELIAPHYYTQSKVKFFEKYFRNYF